MMMRTFAGMTLLALLSSPVFAQSSDVQPKDAPPAFEIADVHTSPHRSFPFRTVAIFMATALLFVRRRCWT